MLMSNEKFSWHTSLSVIEHFRQLRSEHSHRCMDFCVKQIIDFRSGSWGKWSTYYQHRVDFADMMIFKIQERSKSVQNAVVYCSVIHYHTCVTMNLASKHGFYVILTLQFSNYFGCVHVMHASHWSISHVIVRY